MGALANAERPRKEAPRPAKAYADPEAEQPAYAYPGYQQPTSKRLAKRAAYKLPEESVDPKTNPDPPADKAYAHPGYKQPAYKRLAKSFTPKINDYYYDHAAYPVQRYVPPAMDPG